VSDYCIRQLLTAAYDRSRSSLPITTNKLCIKIFYTIKSFVKLAL